MDQVGANLSLLLAAGDWGVCVLRPDRGLLTKHTLFLPSLWEEMGMAGATSPSLFLMPTY